jgi:hypothetical protein
MIGPTKLNASRRCAAAECNHGGAWALVQATAFGMPPVRSKPAHQKQYDEDDQDDADDTDAAVTVTVAVAAEAATEATKQKDYKDDDEYESDRHVLSPFQQMTEH